MSGRPEAVTRAKRGHIWCISPIAAPPARHVPCAQSRHTGGRRFTLSGRCAHTGAAAVNTHGHGRTRLWPSRAELPRASQRPKTHSVSPTRIAYFSMEIGLERRHPDLQPAAWGCSRATRCARPPIWALPLVGVTPGPSQGLLPPAPRRRGQRRRRRRRCGHPEELLEPLDARVTVSHRGARRCRCGAWRYTVHGIFGGDVPVLLLDTDLPRTTPNRTARSPTTSTAATTRYRLCQEVVLGLGGVADAARRSGHDGAARSTT